MIKVSDLGLPSPLTSLTSTAPHFLLALVPAVVGILDLYAHTTILGHLAEVVGANSHKWNSCTYTVFA